MARKLVLLVEASQPEGFSARKMIVESLSHQVVTAHSGAEALALLDRIQPDIVLVHSHLEGESCERIIAEIRQRAPHLAVAALIPGETNLRGPVVTIDSMRPQDLVRFFQSPADPQPA